MSPYHKRHQPLTPDTGVRGHVQVEAVLDPLGLVDLHELGEGALVRRGHSVAKAGPADQRPSRPPRSRTAPAPAGRPRRSRSPPPPRCPRTTREVEHAELVASVKAPERPSRTGLPPESVSEDWFHVRTPMPGLMLAAIAQTRAAVVLHTAPTTSGSQTSPGSRIVDHPAGTRVLATQGQRGYDIHQVLLGRWSHVQVRQCDVRGD
jgi:hypothetical protein